MGVQKALSLSLHGLIKDWGNGYLLILSRSVHSNNLTYSRLFIPFVIVICWGRDLLKGGIMDGYVFWKRG